MVSLAIGVLVATLTATQRVAMLVALLATMLPSTLLSGMVFPLASMPRILQVLSNIVPAKWFIVVARGIMLKGVGLEHLWKETLVLTGMTMAFMIIAVRSFKARVA
jgi:ABC-2 type transport system permease protein